MPKANLSSGPTRLDHPSPAAIAALCESLPRFYDWRNLVSVFHGWDPLIDAYVLGVLPDAARDILEETAGERLSVQLLRRLLRMILESQPAAHQPAAQPLPQAGS